ncbi:uncharacterized protein LOC131674203 [Phymastichus coffea]|uniref:uncharacterized protein LOC131674203 n=1 Tax=Phymastichus coffea TaxID=108790 RepID=UPI00273AC5E9|nr:uncharacterized protein LOC131674203 [Phymastichus coffea]
MGQKLSTSHSSSEISLSKKDYRDSKPKSKKFVNWSREKINADAKPTPTSADAEKLDDNDDDDEDTRKNGEDDDTNSTLAYPSIAELSNFTALSMMRNLEGVSLNAKSLLQQLRNQVKEANEKLIDDEKCFNTINYEDTSMIQFVEKTSLRRDSSTCTNEIKELSRDSSLEDADDADEEKLSCKDSESSVMMEKSEEKKTLEAMLQRVKRERDDAMSKLRIVKVRCEAYEEESKYLEASMESMEEKLRTIASELRSEVAKSKHNYHRAAKARRSAI